MPVIEVKNLVKSYNGSRSKDTNAVKGVSFTVEEGETFGFLGPNGAGKTTTINILCTLLNATEGEARVAGYDCFKESSKVRSSIGLVFQEVTLDNELTAYENLKFHCYMYNMEKSLTEKRIDEIFEVVNLSSRRNDLVKEFSGGMKRRLEIARGLLHRPKVLFLDEPTLGLDPQTRSHVWQFITDLKKKEGNTVFMTTHYMDEAESCDRIAVIDNGEIIACDTPNNLKSSLKGDAIYVDTTDNAKAVVEIRDNFKIEAKVIKNGLIITAHEGEKFIPKLFSELTVGIKSVNLKRPTLDDVFLHLTGRELREEGVGSQDRRFHH